MNMTGGSIYFSRFQRDARFTSDVFDVFQTYGVHKTIEKFPNET